MAAAALTPELALRYLTELSTDVQAAVVLSPDGSLAASDAEDVAVATALAEQVRALLDAADRSAAERGAPESVGEVEATMPAGAVFVVRRDGWVLAAVAGRYALSSLMRYDLRSALADLVGESSR